MKKSRFTEEQIISFLKRELVAIAKTRPGHFTFGSAGNATSNHMAVNCSRPGPV